MNDTTRTIHLRMHVNGVPVERPAARADRLLVDFLHEELGLTGTKLSCGVGACSACKVAVQQSPDAPLMPALACYARLNALHEMHVTTVEGLSRADEPLHPLQAAFLDDCAFQCGYSTPGFLMAGYVLLDELRRAAEAGAPLPADQLDREILDAIGGHVCRCTGYVRYFDAIKRVILATEGLVTHQPAELAGARDAVAFRIIKQSANDLQPKPMIGYFTQIDGQVEFVGGFHFDTCRGEIALPIAGLSTGEPVRDLNLARFFFNAELPENQAIRFRLEQVEPVDRQVQLADLRLGATVPVTVRGALSFAGVRLAAAFDAFIRLVGGGKVRITTRAPMCLDPRDLGFAVQAFAEEFGLELQRQIEVTFDVGIPYAIR